MNKLIPVLLLVTINTAHAESPERRETRVSAKQILRALTHYLDDCGAYPTTEQGLDALFEKPDRGPCAHWGPKPYLEALTKDGWGHYWNYEADTQAVKVTSFGADGLEGGTGEDEDLVFRANR